MNESESSVKPENQPNPRPKPRFSLRWIFLLTLLTAVTAATWGGLTREGPDRIKFLFFGTMAPLAVLLLVGLLHQLFGKKKR